jgi:AcrR family transcriptional regulator
MGSRRRPQILAAAAKVIARRGITGLRLADVADEAGVSVGTVQYYFGRRETLLMETFAFVSQRAVDRWLQQGTDGADSWARLVALVDIVIDPGTFRERWTRWLQFWAAYARDPKLRRRMSAAYEEWRLPFRQAIEAGVAAGQFQPARPIDVLVDRAVALFDGLALQVLLEAPGASVERMRELLLDGLAVDLGVAPGGGRSGRAQRAQKGTRAERAASIPSRPRAGSSGT